MKYTWTIGWIMMVIACIVTKVEVNEFHDLLNWTGWVLMGLGLSMGTMLHSSDRLWDRN